MGLDSLSPQDRPLNAQAILPAVQGVFQSDILIRQALIIGFNDLRQNPWQLQLVFNGLRYDNFTKEQYGEKEITKAVNWFLKTEIPVVMDYNLTSSPAMPIVVVSLDSCTEAEATLGDLHYETEESTPAEWQPLTQKFVGNYNATTGVLIPSIPVIVNTQMVLVDGAGNRYPILDLFTDPITSNCYPIIQKGLNTDFNNCVLEWASSKLSVQLESCNFKETYNIICNAKGEASELLYLWSIVMYSLMRYKKTLLEGRGFERTVISSTKVMTNNSLAPVGSENVWSRVISITGFNKMTWARTVSDKITQASFGPDSLNVSQINFLPNQFETDSSLIDPGFLTGDGIGVSV
jgi:hypothetical protein